MSSVELTTSDFKEEQIGDGGLTIYLFMFMSLVLGIVDNNRPDRKVYHMVLEYLHTCDTHWAMMGMTQGGKRGNMRGIHSLERFKGL